MADYFPSRHLLIALLANDREIIGHVRHRAMRPADAGDGSTARRTPLVKVVLQQAVSTIDVLTRSDLHGVQIGLKANNAGQVFCQNPFDILE